VEGDKSKKQRMRCNASLVLLDVLNEFLSLYIEQRKVSTRRKRKNEEGARGKRKKIREDMYQIIYTLTQRLYI
jgi:hypothetical protein